MEDNDIGAGNRQLLRELSNDHESLITFLA